jgi:hypothetical protein
VIGNDGPAPDDVDELEAARLARLRVIHDMTMSERLARAHELCAQLAKLRPVERSSHVGS